MTHVRARNRHVVAILNQQPCLSRQNNISIQLSQVGSGLSLGPDKRPKFRRSAQRGRVHQDVVLDGRQRIQYHKAV